MALLVGASTAGFRSIQRLGLPLLTPRDGVGHRALALVDMAHFSTPILVLCVGSGSQKNRHNDRETLHHHLEAQKKFVLSLNLHTPKKSAAGPVQYQNIRYLYQVRVRILSFFLIKECSNIDIDHTWYSYWYSYS